MSMMNDVMTCASKNAAPPSESARCFAEGNYVAAAMTRDAASWQTHAALGLCGLTAPALEGIARFNLPEARFYQAAALWIAGDEPAAVDILSRLDLPHARALLALIRKPQIHVLAQLPWTRQAPFDLLSAAQRDGKFQITNISFHPQDVRNEFNADVRRFYDPGEPPDFYISAMVEWHVLPANLAQLPCPLFGQSADYDLHLQAVRPALGAFDALLATDPTEWHDLRRLTRGPVYTFPKCFGLSDTLPPAPAGAREVDLFLSGTLIHPYHPDKALLMRQVLGLEDVTVRFLNGFTDLRSYLALLGHTKVSFSYVRHPGALPTRALEALSMGAAVVVQEGSCLRLYADESAGCFTYADAGDLPDAIRRVVREWPVIAPKALRGAEILRREFALSRVGPQYLRFLTVLAACTRPGRRRTAAAPLVAKRTVLSKGWLPGGRAVMQNLRDANLAVWQETLRKQPTPQLLNDMGREMALHCAHADPDAPPDPALPQMLDQTLRLYEAGLKRFPRRLVLRFNLIRVALHLGNESAVAQALRLLAETLAAPASAWEVDPDDDVFPYDAFGSYFNYRTYLDTLFEQVTSGKPAAPKLVRLILASLHHYAGHYSGDAASHEQAVQMDPAFPFYRLYAAEALLRRGRADDVQKAGGLLTDLAENSLLFVEAFELLEQLQAQGTYICPRFAEIAARVDRVRRYGFTRGDWRQETLQALPAATPPREGALRLAFTQDRMKRPVRLALDAEAPAGADRILLTGVVQLRKGVDQAEALLCNLANQTVQSRLEVLLVAEEISDTVQRLVRRFQPRFARMEVLAPRNGESAEAAIARVLAEAPGRYGIILHPAIRRRTRSLERLIEALESDPTTALAYCDMEVVRAQRGADTRVRIGACKRPDFDRRRLFQDDYIGLESVWRTSLFTRYGPMDPTYGAAMEYEFRLRIARTEKFRHVPLKDGIPAFVTDGPADVELPADTAEADRARAAHWPAGWGARPPLHRLPCLPGCLAVPLWKFEAEASYLLGGMSAEEHNAVFGMMTLAQDALDRGDADLAEVALREAAENARELQSLRLVLGAFLRWRGHEAEARDVWARGLETGAYRAALLNRLTPSEGTHA